MSAFFVVIDGIDGAGKQTQSVLLEKKLQQKGYRVGRIEFPAYEKTIAGRDIRSYLKGEFGSLNSLHPKLISYLYAVDRYEMQDQLRSLLWTKDVVIADRYVVSNIAYQTAKLPKKHKQNFRDWCAHLDYQVFGAPRENMTLFLSISTELSSELIKRRQQTSSHKNIKSDLHEKNLQYLQKVYAEYKELGKTWANWYEITCEGSGGELRQPNSISKEIFTLVYENIAQSIEVSLPQKSLEVVA